MPPSEQGEWLTKLLDSICNRVIAKDLIDRGQRKYLFPGIFEGMLLPVAKIHLHDRAQLGTTRA